MSTMSNFDVHGQIASIMEVLANAAVSEICKLVDDGYAVLRLEISKSQNEIDTLKKKLHMTRLRCRRVCSERNGTQGHGMGRLSSPAVQLPGKTFMPSRNFQNKHGVERARTVSHDLDLRKGHSELLKMSCVGQQQVTDANMQQPTVKAEDADCLTKSHKSRESTVKDDDTSESGASSTKEVAPGETRSGRSRHTYPPPQVWKPEGEGKKGTNADSLVRTWQEAGQTIENPLLWIQEQGPPGSASNTAAANMDDETIATNKPPPANDQDDLFSSGSIDWEPDLVLVDSVPIKVETDMSTDWNITDHGAVGSNNTSAFDIACPPLNARCDMPDPTPHLLAQAPQANQPHRLPSLSRTAGSPPFRCVSCGKVFLQMAHLKRHERVHTGEKPFCCLRCGKRFSHRHQLTNHVRVHTGEKPFRCLHCGRRFTQSSHMKRHLSTHTGQTRSHSCSTCGRWYTTQGSLIRHQRAGCTS